MSARRKKRLADVLVITVIAAVAAVFLLHRRNLLPRLHKADPVPRKEVRAIPYAGSGTNAMAETSAFAALGPKVSGTDANRAAVEHIVSRLKSHGLEPVVDVFEDASPAGKTVFRNIEVSIPGLSSGIVVVACHFDTKSGISPSFLGANDSASGVGLLIDLARALHATRPHTNTYFVAFLDGEECIREYAETDGLHGSRRLADRLVSRGLVPSVKGVFILDMIGDRDLTVTLAPNSTPSLMKSVFDAASAEGVRSKFSLASTPILDDHVPFLRKGMPAVDIMDFQYGSTPGANDYWHTDRDTMDKLSPKSLETVGRVTWRAMTGL